MSKVQAISDSTYIYAPGPNHGQSMLLHSQEYRNHQTLEEWAAELRPIKAISPEKVFQSGTPNEASHDWGFLLLSLIGVSFLGIVFAFYRRRFNLLVNVLFNWKLSKQIIRYEKVHSHPVNLMLMATFLIFFPLFYSLSLSYLKPEFDFFFLLQNLLLFVLAYILIKLILYQFTAWLFEEGELFSQYIFQLNLFTKLMGVILLILWIFLIYSPVSTDLLFKISLFFLILFLTLQTLRGFIIGRAEGRNLLLIILYLCTLEILPWLLIYKSLENNW